VNAVASQVPSHLARAVDALKNLGIAVREPDSSPIAALLRNVAEIDEVRSLVVARTLAQQEIFDTVVADQVEQMTVGQRFEDITKGFDSIRSDAKRMVDSLSDGQVGIRDRVENIIMKVTRGDIAYRFNAIRNTYKDVIRDVQVQIAREDDILSAYSEFRGALKEAEVLAYEILETAEKRLNDSKANADAAAAAVDISTGSQADKARLELLRDGAMQAFKKEDDRYQVAKDLADNLRVSYGATEVVMSRLAQSHSAKERIWKQAVTFFATNTTVLSALKASFTGIAGLHEATMAVEAMKAGTNKSLETLADVGWKVQEQALRSGYGPTIQATSVQKLLDSVVDFQVRSRDIIDEMRALSTKNAKEIHDGVEDGKRRLLALASRGNGINV
jgi:hypothetical protein